ncbi:MAG: DUF11 domain-containing protein, partial [Actinomycetota bacterium]|nr:DUF11 domain-containing protein [Actinomycetota bacterium]
MGRTFGRRWRTPTVIAIVPLLLLTVLQPWAGAADKAPDLTVSVSGPASVVFPNDVTFQVTVTNNGDDHAASVDLTNVLTGGTHSSSTPSCNPTCNLGQINKNGDSETVTFVASPTAAGTDVVLSAAVTTTTTESNAGNNTGSATTTVSPAVVSATVAPDVSITKVDNVTTSATTGTAYAYTLTVSNSGAAPALNVTVTDNLDNDLTFNSATVNPASAGSCSAPGGNVSCNLGTMAASSTVTITLNVTPKTTAAGKTIANTATVSATGDVTSGNNSSTENTAVASSTSGGTTGGGNNGDTKITNIAGQTFNSPHVPCEPFKIFFDGYDASQDLTYALITQSPTTPADDIIINLTDITTGAAGDPDEGSFLTAQINLANTLLTTYTRDAQGYHLQVVDQSVVDSSLPNTGVKTKTFFVDCASGDVTVEKQISSGSDQTETFDFTATLTTGSTTTFSDTADDLGDGDDESFAPDEGGTFGLVEAAVTGWATPQIVCTKDSDGSTVTTTSTNSGRGVTFTLLTADITCVFTNTQLQPDVKITKTATASVQTGGTINYTLLIENIGNTTAASATLTDNLTTTGVTFGSFTSNPGNVCSHALNEIACTVTNLAAGGSITVTFTATAPSAVPTGGKVTNTA